MAVGELLRQPLVEPAGHGRTALVVDHTHTHVRDQLAPIFETNAAANTGSRKTSTG